MFAVVLRNSLGFLFCLLRLSLSSLVFINLFARVCCRTFSCQCWRVPSVGRASRSLVLWLLLACAARPAGLGVCCFIACFWRLCSHENWCCRLASLCLRGAACACVVSVGISLSLGVLLLRCCRLAGDWGIYDVPSLQGPLVTSPTSSHGATRPRAPRHAPLKNDPVSPQLCPLKHHRALLVSAQERRRSTPTRPGPTAQQHSHRSLALLCGNTYSSFIDHIAGSASSLPRRPALWVESEKEAVYPILEKLLWLAPPQTLVIILAGKD
jgi:hypothetical protein